jgi:hypothetical protein
MHHVDFAGPSGLEHHECESSIEGDWIVFRCPLCKDYERRIHQVTSEMKVKNISAWISHSGRHVSLEHLAMISKAGLN